VRFVFGTRVCQSGEITARERGVADESPAEKSVDGNLLCGVVG
jgi:hypothetical protein